MILALLEDRTDPARSVPGSSSWGANLPARLTAEWSYICADPAAMAAVAWWDDAELAGAPGPNEILDRVQSPDAGAGQRDATLCALLRRAQAGDALAGRVVLQVMLPKAVQIGAGLSRWLDGDREEAFAMVFAALWRTIMTYPLQRRPQRVTGNLAMETLSLVRGREAQRRQQTDTPYGDLLEAEAFRAGGARAGGPGGATGQGWSCGPGADVPVDVELISLLNWAVPERVLTPEQTQLLARVYGLERGDGPDVDGPALAAQLGLAWPALRQRCHRLARVLRSAALDAGITGMAG